MAIRVTVNRQPRPVKVAAYPKQPPVTETITIYQLDDGYF
jgi:hypothetical protein